jgi:hypothetical protein
LKKRLQHSARVIQQQMKVEVGVRKRLNSLGYLLRVFY